jgi:hypothetical protein
VSVLPYFLLARQITKDDAVLFWWKPWIVQLDRELSVTGHTRRVSKNALLYLALAMLFYVD